MGKTAIAGFNLGDYKVVNMETVNGIKVQVAANSDLENAIMERVRAQGVVGPDLSEQGRPNRRSRGPITPTFNEEPTLPVAGALREVGTEISDAIALSSSWMGPFPYHQWSGQLPGDLGQGFPDFSTSLLFRFLPTIHTTADRNDRQLTGNP